MKKFKEKILKKIDKGSKNVHYGNIVLGIGLILVLIGSFTSGLSDMGPLAGKILTGVLIAVGFIVGCMNVTKSETVPFIVASIAVVILFAPFMTSLIQTYEIKAGSMFAEVIGEIFKNIISLVVPAALVVSLKSLFLNAKAD